MFGFSVLRILISVFGGAACGFALGPAIWGWKEKFRPFTALRVKAIEIAQAALFLMVGLFVFILEIYEDAFVEPLIFSLVGHVRAWGIRYPCW